MRICLLNHNLNTATGAGRFGANFVARLTGADPDIDATVLTTVASGHPLERPILAANRLGLLFALPQIRAEFRRADIIHALDGWPYGAIAALASLGLGRKLVITAVGTGAVQFLDSPLRGILLRWTYRRARCIAAISGYTRREILKRVPGLTITVINHAVDAEEFAGDPLEALSEIEKREIEKLRPYVLSVGGWKRRKGFEYSFAAFAGIRERFPAMRYVVCGIGAKPRLEQPLGLGGSVSYFKGVRWPFLKALYRSAELFVLLPVDDARDIEGFGFAFLEAAAAGLPVVGTHDSGSEDAVRDGENGFLVPQRDSKAAAEASIRILSDGGLRQRFSEASRSFAASMNWERVTAAYADIYRDIQAKS